MQRPTESPQRKMNAFNSVEQKSCQETTKNQSQGRSVVLGKNCWEAAMDNSNIFGTVLTELPKAFDCLTMNC